MAGLYHFAIHLSNFCANIAIPLFMRPPAAKMRRMATSDHPFKLIHADPRMVEDTLRGFVALDWADRLDFSTLAPLDMERIGPALHSRIGDKAWRVERRDGVPLNTASALARKPPGGCPSCRPALTWTA